MPRRKLEKKKTALIQILLLPEEKEAFDYWCASRNTTMSDIIRKEIAPYIREGLKNAPKVIDSQLVGDVW